MLIGEVCKSICIRYKCFYRSKALGSIIAVDSVILKAESLAVFIYIWGNGAVEEIQRPFSPENVEVVEPVHGGDPFTV